MATKLLVGLLVLPLIVAATDKMEASSSVAKSGDEAEIGVRAGTAATTPRLAAASAVARGSAAIVGGAATRAAAAVARSGGARNGEACAGVVSGSEFAWRSGACCGTRLNARPIATSMSSGGMSLHLQPKSSELADGVE